MSLTMAIIFALLWVGELSNPGKEAWKGSKIMFAVIVVALLSIGLHIAIVAIFDLVVAVGALALDAVVAACRGIMKFAVWSFEWLVR